MRRFERLGVAVLALMAMAAGAGREPLPVLEFRNGHWFNGVGFVDEIWYSVDGRLTRLHRAVVERVVDLAGGYVVPPFGAAYEELQEAALDEDLERLRRVGVLYVRAPGRRAESKRERRGVEVFRFGPRILRGPPIRADRGLPGAEIADEAMTLEGREALEARWSGLAAASPGLLEVVVTGPNPRVRRPDGVSCGSSQGLSPELFQAVVERAHADGLSILARIATAADFRVAVRGGADIVAPVPGAVTPGAPVPQRASSPCGPETFRLLPEDVELAAAEELEVVVSLARPLDSDAATERRFENEALVPNLRLLREAGVRLTLATSREAPSLAALGVFDPVELLRLWSETTPEAVFPGRKLGRFREGYEASLLVLGGDPRRDFGNATAIVRWFKGGRELPPLRSVASGGAGGAAAGLPRYSAGAALDGR